jgi:hypothetical protein
VDWPYTTGIWAMPSGGLVCLFVWNHLSLSQRWTGHTLQAFEQCPVAPSDRNHINEQWTSLIGDGCLWPVLRPSPLLFSLSNIDHPSGYHILTFYGPVKLGEHADHLSNFDWDISSKHYCGSYYDFLGGGLLLTRKLLDQGFLVDKQLFDDTVTTQDEEELGESSNYYIISKTVAHPLIYSILSPQQSKVRLFTPFEMATILLFHSVDFL